MSAVLVRVGELPGATEAFLECCRMYSTIPWAWLNPTGEIGLTNPEHVELATTGMRALDNGWSRGVGFFALMAISIGVGRGEVCGRSDASEEFKWFTRLEAFEYLFRGERYVQRIVNRLRFEYYAPIRSEGHAEMMKARPGGHDARLLTMLAKLDVVSAHDVPMISRGGEA